MSTSEKIAHAYGVLVARGDKLTVRAVQKEAGVRIGEVAAWMREHAAGATGDVPEAPDLSEAMSAMVQSVWAAAWKRAAEQADALTAAETAATERAAAIASRDQAAQEADQLGRELSQLRDQLDTARQEAKDARAQADDADRARVRAEASSDTLREVLDSLRESTRGSEE
ncbi:MAG: DNA-binding protein [Nocardioidaceae bacterium]|nr:DNA-binding protein [Nocardioidaceae bacterium]